MPLPLHINFPGIGQMAWKVLEYFKRFSKLFSSYFSNFSCSTYTQSYLTPLCALLHPRATAPAGLFSRVCPCPDCLGLHYYSSAFWSFYNKIRVIVGKIAIMFRIIKPDVDCKIIFCIGYYVWAFFQKTGKFKLKMAITNNPIKNAFYSR